jgi:metallo-beta-lactamase family protein
MFLGAAGYVTGSRFLIEAGRSRVLVDCGLCQERENLCHNWDPLAVSPATIQSVLLTHAHLDHCGWLPRLVKEGFRGRIYCTAPTIDIARILLADSARIMEEDAEAKRLRHQREGRRGPYPEVPLYTVQDAEAVSRLFTPVQYGRPVQVAQHISAEFRDAGHILGSATVRVSVARGRSEQSILFSGDLGRPGRPIVQDPDGQRGASSVVIESTYGDRVHPREDVEERLGQVIRETVAAGGNVVIPAFAVERAQELMYHLGRLVTSGRIPPVPVLLDSPMAQSVTQVFEKYPDLLDPDVARALRAGRSPFDFPGLRYVRGQQESEGVDRTAGSKVIIAGSGMATGGRIKRHLINNIGRPESTVLFVGYQAQGTLGRQILDGMKPVRILGAMYPVRARIERIDAFSAHADRDGLLEWLESLRPAPQRVFLVHGEEAAARSFGQLLHGRNGWDVSVPAHGETVDLGRAIIAPSPMSF